MKEYRIRFVLGNMLLVGLALLLIFVAIEVFFYMNYRSELENTMRILVEPWDSQTQVVSETSSGEDSSGLLNQSSQSGQSIASAIMLLGTEQSMDRQAPVDAKPDESFSQNQPPNGNIAPDQPPDGQQPDISSHDDFSSRNEPIPNGDLQQGGNKKANDSGVERQAPQQKNENAQQNISVFFVEKGSKEISVLSNDASLKEDSVSQALNEIVNAEEDFGVLQEYGLIYYRQETNDNYKLAIADISYLRYRLVNITLILLGVYIASMGVFLFISIRLSKIAVRPMEQAIEMERRFVADISHDLKTPIAVVLANNSILKENPDTTVGQQKQWIESTDNAVNNMMTMINEMLTLSMLESAEIKAAKQSVNASQTVEKCELQMDSLAYEHGVSLESDISEGVWIMANQEYAERICTGLIENAIKYEPIGGTVRIVLARTKKHAVFTVQNQGSLIPPDDLPHIFERFYRGDKTRNEKKGYGLGLSIIHRMCDMIGAKIKAESNEQVGTRFTVTFEPTSGN
ncbi:MAG: hypothetical protein IJM51_10380 [Clostridia bacterium]|nr:hypothetical protein [Clostridia bacterium]